MEDIVNIKKDYYSYPVQVRFCQRLDDGSFMDDDWGIAYQDKIICLACGELIDLDDDDTIIWEECSEWVELSQSLGDAVEYAAEWE
jgi:hypothetical protein